MQWVFGQLARRGQHCRVVEDLHRWCYAKYVIVVFHTCKFFARFTFTKPSFSYTNHLVPLTAMGGPGAVTRRALTSFNNLGAVARNNLAQQRTQVGNPVVQAMQRI